MRSDRKPKVKCQHKWKKLRHFDVSKVCHKCGAICFRGDSDVYHFRDAQGQNEAKKRGYISK